MRTLSRSFVLAVLFATLLTFSACKSMGGGGGGDGPGGGGGGKGKCAECGRPNGENGLLDEEDQQGLVADQGTVTPGFENNLNNGANGFAGGTGDPSVIGGSGNPTSSDPNVVFPGGNPAVFGSGIGANGNANGNGGAVTADPATGQPTGTEAGAHGDSGSPSSSASGDHPAVETHTYSAAPKDVQPFPADASISRSSVFLRDENTKSLGLISSPDQLMRKMSSITLKVKDKEIKIADPVGKKLGIDGVMFWSWKISEKGINEALRKELTAQGADLKDVKEIEISKVEAEELRFDTRLKEKAAE